MSSKTTNPVVQIVDGDEQDVGLFVLGKARASQQQEAKKCKDGFHVICSVTIHSIYFSL
jgi:hypothetical protein